MLYLWVYFFFLSNLFNINYIISIIVLYLGKQRLFNNNNIYNVFNFFFFDNRGIAKAGEPNNLAPMTPGLMLMDSSSLMLLRNKQRRMIREHPGVLQAISKGVNMALQECQHQFRNRRWNCSTKNFLTGKNLFGKIVDRGKQYYLYYNIF